MSGSFEKPPRGVLSKCISWDLTRKAFQVLSLPVLVVFQLRSFIKPIVLMSHLMTLLCTLYQFLLHVSSCVSPHYTKQCFSMKKERKIMYKYKRVILWLLQMTVHICRTSQSLTMWFSLFCPNPNSTVQLSDWRGKGNNMTGFSSILMWIS